MNIIMQCLWEVRFKPSMLRHFIGLLLCLPEVTRNVSKAWSAALVRHAALLAAAAGLVHVATALRDRFQVASCKAHVRCGRMQTGQRRCPWP